MRESSGAVGREYALGVIPILVVSLVLAQAQESRAPVAVVITSKRPGAEAVAAKIAARVQETLKREGVGGLMDDATAAKELKAAGFSDPRSCDGGQSCITKLAVLLGPRAVVVGVDVGKIGKNLAIHLEAIAADLSEPLAAADISAASDKWGDQAAVGITVFVRGVKEKLPLKKAVAELKTPEVKPKDKPKDVPSDVPKDTPKVVKLEPKPKDRPIEVVAPTGGGSKAGAWALTGTAVAAAGAGAGFAAVGMGDKAKYDQALITTPDGLKGTTLTQAEASALAGSANTKLTIALTSAIASVALTGAAVYLFTKD